VHGDILIWNKAHEELTGYSEEDIAAMKIWDIQWKLLSKEYKKKTLQRAD
jgi:PAS domain S-box-containing protein